MRGRRLTAVTMAALSVLWAPTGARAADTDAERGIQLYSKACGTPIGRLDGFGTLAINGRLARGGDVIWGGELLEALTPSGASVELAGLGRVALGEGTRVRLAVGDGGWLVASLLNGRLVVRLEAECSAYLEAGGRIFTTTRGAAFRVGVRAGEPEVAMTRGRSQEGGATPQVNQIFKLRPVGLGASESVKARSRRTVQVQVTDDHDRKVPDVPVLFALSQANDGLLSVGQASGASVTATTNAEGVASVTFEAGPAGSTSEITASIPGSPTETITLTKFNVAAGGLSTAAIVTIVLVAGGLTAGGLVIATRGGSDDRAITPTGPPVINP